MAFVSNNRDNKLYLCDANGINGYSYIKTYNDSGVKLASGSYTTVNMTGSNYLEISPMVGDLSYSGSRRDATPVMHRGSIFTVTYGDDQPLSGSFSVKKYDARMASAATTFQAHINRGYIHENWTSAWTVPGPANLEFYYNLVQITEATDRGDASDHVLVFGRVRLTSDLAEGAEGDAITFNFTSFFPEPFVGNAT